MKERPGIDVFGEMLQLSPNPMTGRFGRLEPPRECGECVFFQRGRKSYHKCIKRGITNGAGTDHRVHWPACRLFEEAKQ